MATSSAQSPRIRVLIADDSLVMREILSQIVKSAPSLEVCGMAQNGVEAIDKVRELQPDVVTLDIQMPLLNGIEVLKKIMADSPRPVIMISSHGRQGADVTLEALSLGAFDCLSKFEAGRALDTRNFRDRLVARIEAAVRTSDKSHGGSKPTPPALQKTGGQPQARPGIIAIGTSTGGPGALQEILPELPPDFPAPIIIVQHMPVGFTAPLAKRLDLMSEIDVREAEHGETLDAGTAYLAPAGKQITVQRAFSRVNINLSDDFPGILHKPSVDLMMLSVAAIFGRHACGVILTGMGCDGLQGMTAIHRAEGITVGQDEASCTVYGMPRACVERAVVQRVVPLEDMTKEILRIVNYGGKPEKKNAIRNPKDIELRGLLG